MRNGDQRFDAVFQTFVNDFIISQLMVKRTNILKLFSGPNPKNASTLKTESGALA